MGVSVCIPASFLSGVMLRCTIYLECQLPNVTCRGRWCENVRLDASRVSSQHGSWHWAGLREQGGSSNDFDDL